MRSLRELLTKKLLLLLIVTQTTTTTTAAAIIVAMKLLTVLVLLVVAVMSSSRCGDAPLQIARGRETLRQGGSSTLLTQIVDYLFCNIVYTACT
jgi:hypothetical protein